MFFMMLIRNTSRFKPISPSIYQAYKSLCETLIFRRYGVTKIFFPFDIELYPSVIFFMDVNNTTQFKPISLVYFIPLLYLITLSNATRFKTIRLVYFIPLLYLITLSNASCFKYMSQVYFIPLLYFIMLITNASRFNQCQLEGSTSNKVTWRQLFEVHKLWNKAKLSFYLKKSNMYRCKMCLRNLKTQKTLSRHMRTIHKEGRFKCSQCEKLFSRRDNLKRYEKNCPNIWGGISKR